MFIMKYKMFVFIFICYTYIWNRKCLLKSIIVFITNQNKKNKKTEIYRTKEGTTTDEFPEV